MDKDLKNILKQIELLKDTNARIKYYRNEIDEILIDNWLENHPVEETKCEVISLNNIYRLPRKKR